MHRGRFPALLVLAFVLAGCSTASRLEELLPPSGEVAVVNRHATDVLVSVTGGDELTVSNRTFNSALVQTLNNTGVFSSARNYGVSKYKLIVVILTLERSAFGSQVDISSHWILRGADGTEVWSDSVTGTGNSYAFAGVARIRASHEGAAKAAIIEGVGKLSQLSL